MTQWLTIEQAASRVGRAPGTVRRWIRDGELRQFPNGRVRAEHLVALDKRMRSKVGRPKGSSLTVPLVLDGREVGSITIRPDGEISGRMTA